MTDNISWSNLEAMVSNDVIEALQARFEQIKDYVPRIGILGKTGVGKSSICNALFGDDICEVSDVQSCTREPKEVLLELGQDRKIILLDVPGVGENQARDSEYEALYRKLLPELDLLLWVIKADERAYGVELEYSQMFLQPCKAAGLPFFLVLNQVDKLNPVREWNETLNQPGDGQMANIDAKCAVVAESFAISPATIIPVSATCHYGLGELVTQMIMALPDTRRISVFAQVRPENRTDEARTEVRASLFRIFEEVIQSALSGSALGARYFGKVGAFVGMLAGAAVGLVMALFL